MSSVMQDLKILFQKETKCIFQAVIKLFPKLIN